MGGNLENRLGKKFRALTLALIFSGALNIGLIAAFIFSVLQGRESHLSVSPLRKGEEKKNSTIQRTLSQMSKLTFHELVPLLTNRDLVEEGYSKRDLAVSALTSFHHFNLEKALAGFPSQMRVVSLGDDLKAEVFPGLTDMQFEAIIRFAYEEKWPITTKGIFKLLKKMTDSKDESLIQAFTVTPEFHALQVLFQKTQAPQDNAVLIKLVSEGNWEVFESFAKTQAQLLDLSLERRRSLLMSYLLLKSPTAATLLVKTDFSFAAKQLEDRDLGNLISLLEKTAEAESFCIEVLRAPRTDAVWQAASYKLYAFSGDDVPSSFDLKQAREKFAPSNVSRDEKGVVLNSTALSPAVSKKPVFREHVVKPGESLWKIARQYKMKVDDLVRMNELEKESLYPGMTLRIPQGTGSEPPL